MKCTNGPYSSCHLYPHPLIGLSCTDTGLAHILGQLNSSRRDVSRGLKEYLSGSTSSLGRGSKPGQFAEGSEATWNRNESPQWCWPRSLAPGPLLQLPQAYKGTQRRAAKPSQVNVTGQLVLDSEEIINS